MTTKLNDKLQAVLKELRAGDRFIGHGFACQHYADGVRNRDDLTFDEKLEVYDAGVGNLRWAAHTRMNLVRDLRKAAAKAPVVENLKPVPFYEGGWGVGTTEGTAAQVGPGNRVTSYVADTTGDAVKLTFDNATKWAAELNDAGEMPAGHTLERVS